MKRIKSLALALVMLLSLCVFVPANAAVADEESVVVSEDLYGLEFDTLTALGILDKVNGQTDKIVTRGEFTDIAVRTAGYDSTMLASYSNQCFNDVEGFNPYGNAINAAYALGYVKGDGNGNFNPNAPISLEEACSILSRVMGLSTYADMSGAIATAQKLGFLSGVNVQDSKLNLKQVVRIIYNALNEATYDVVGYEGENAVLSNDKTLAEVKFNVTKVNGIVSANEDTSLTSETGVGEHMIQIDNEVYDVGETNAASMLGYQVTAYIKDADKDGGTVVSIGADSKNRVIVIDADDILSETDTKNIIYLNDKDRQQTANLASDVAVIYNGKLIAYTPEDLHINVGRLTLISNTGENKYNVVLIETYQNIFLSSIDTDTMTLNNLYGQPVGGKGTTVTIYDEEDLELGTSVLQKYDVLSVYQTRTVKGDNVVKAYRSDKEPVSGSVERIEEINGYKYITVEGKTYKVTKQYTDYSNINPDKAPKLKVGMSATFYFDRYGEVAGVVSGQTSDTMYAYLIRMYPDVEHGQDDIPILRIFTQSNEFLELEAERNITLNQQRVDSSVLFNNEILVKNGSVVPQLIKYKANADGKLTKIEVADKNRPTIAQKADQNVFTFNERRTGIYRTGPLKFADLYITDANSIIFSVPNIEENEDPNDEQLYDIFMGIQLGYDTEYTIDIYDSSKTNLMGVGVTQMSVGYNYEGVPFTVVQSISKSVDENDEECYMLEGFTSGNPVSYIFDKNCRFENFENDFTPNEKGKYDETYIHEGDIVQLIISKNKIVSIKILFRDGHAPEGYNSDRNLGPVNYVIYPDTFTKRSGTNAFEGDTVWDYAYQVSFMGIANTTESSTEGNVFSMYWGDDASGEPRFISYLLQYTRVYKVEYARNKYWVTPVDAMTIRESDSTLNLNGSRIIMNTSKEDLQEIFILESLRSDYE